MQLTVIRDRGLGGFGLEVSNLPAEYMCLPFNIKVFKGKESSISRAGGSEEKVFKGYVLKLG